jgi:hypothetical protein
MKNRALALAFIIILLFSFSHAISTENSWETKPPMHFSRTGAVAADVNGIVYVIGGSQKYNTSDTGFSYIYINSTEAYEPATDTCVDKAPMPTPREGLGQQFLKKKSTVLVGKMLLRARRAR